MRLQKKDHNQSPIIHNPRKRLLAVLLLAAFSFAAVLGKMFAVMVVQSGDLQAKAVTQWMRDVPTEAARGRILDRNGTVLADTATRYNIYVRPNATGSKQDVAKLLAEVFGYEYNDILAKISVHTSEVTVARGAGKEQLDALMESGLSGIYYGEDNLRYYPFGDFMAQALGFTGFDGEGQTGLEAYYDKYLTGTDGMILTDTDLVGREIEGGGSYYIPAVKGMDVVTTLDATIQRIAEGALRTAAARFEPKAAACVVMNYETGEILALAEYPSFDLNDVPRDDLETLFGTSKSSVVSTVYEPGSTFKILTAAAALDAGKVGVTDRYYCSGTRVVDGQKIRCWKAKGHGSISFAEGVEQSCNCVFMDSALAMGTELFYDYLDAFGLRAKTGVDITGETSGIFIPEQSVKSVDLARIGFGQAVAVTPIGMLAAAASVVNGGRLVTPHLLSGIPEGNPGETVSGSFPDRGTTVSAATSETMRVLLENVVKNGSGKSAYVPGYRIGGKTGTAQKYENGHIAQGKYISSFLGFSFEEEAPFAVMLLVDEPQGYMYYGSLVAAPLVGDVFGNIFAYLGASPEFTGEEAEVIGTPFSLADYTGMSVQQARAKLAALGLHVETDGEGSTVKGQIPAAGTVVDGRNTVLLFT